MGATSRAGPSIYCISKQRQAGVIREFLIAGGGRADKDRCFAIIVLPAQQREHRLVVQVV
jgi:hypothetical protein